MDYMAHVSSPLGGITLCCDGERLTGLWFDGQKRFGSTLRAPYAVQTVPVLEQAAAWLDAYFRGQVPDVTPPLALRGTAFQRAVWETLLTIPYGQRVTYAALARRLGLSPAAARAVGGAVGRNPVSLIVPCHRVVGAGGRLTGYAGGLERKRWLLSWEQGTPDL